jgi:hypothetical protein
MDLKHHNSSQRFEKHAFYLRAFEQKDFERSYVFDEDDDQYYLDFREMMQKQVEQKMKKFE